MKEIKLSDIYVPHSDSIVIEFEFITKTKGGIELPDQMLKEYAESQGFAKQVMAVGPEVKNYKIGDWILFNSRAQMIPVPLIYHSSKGKQHGQIHEYDVLGKVDSDFAKVTTTKELTIN